MKIYIVFGDHSEGIADYLSREFEVVGWDRTLEAASINAGKLEIKPDAILVLGSALVTGITGGSINYGTVLVENLYKLRTALPESVIKVILSEKAGNDVIKGIVALGIYDICQTDKLSVEMLPEILKTKKTIANYSGDIQAIKPDSRLLLADTKVEIVSEDESHTKSRSTFFRHLAGRNETKQIKNKVKDFFKQVPLLTENNGVKSAREKHPTPHMNLPASSKLKPVKYIAVSSPWIPGGASTLASLLASELAESETVAAVDCDLAGRGLGVRFGIPAMEVWEWDWRETDTPVVLNSGVTLWPLDPFREKYTYDEKHLKEVIEQAGEAADRVVLDAGTDPDAWWFKVATEKAGVLVWVFRADPVLLARAKCRWENRPALRELSVLYGSGDPAEVEAMFGLSCIHIREDDALRQLISQLDSAAEASPGLRALLVGFEDVLPAHDAVSTIYDARRWLDRNTPAAVVLSSDLPDLIQFVRDIKSDPRMADIPVGVVGGGPEALTAGADDILFELSLEAVELLIAKAARIKDIREEADRDALTGLLVRRAGEKMLNNALKECRKRGEPFSAALLDLDHFKRVNDTYGHAAGDTVLNVFGDFLKKNLRSMDLAVRWGGEEFLLAFPGTSVEGAVRACKNLLQQWRKVAIPLPNGGTLQTTFSAGIAECRDILEAISAADEALYQAKSEGRARVFANVTSPYP